MLRLLFFFHLFIPVVGLANQNFKGKLIDNNKKAIPYANIIIKNTNIGTISNHNGDFSINLPQKHIKSSLLFSAIGFKTKEIQIANLKSKHTIILETNTISLGEVTIKVKATKANDVVKEAFAHYKDNFPIKPFIGKVFYRHIEKNKNKYRWYVDGAGKVYDPGFNKYSDKIQLNISEVRNSLDNRKIDTTSIYYFYLVQKLGHSHNDAFKQYRLWKSKNSEIIKKAITYYDYRVSNPLFILGDRSNVIRNYNQKDAIFDHRIAKKHHFKFDSVLLLNNEEIYKIKILPHKPLAKLNKHYGKGRIPTGWIYIRAKDYAIIELEYVLLYSKKAQICTDVFGSKIASHFKVKYREINHKMYPVYLKLKTTKSHNLNSNINSYAHNKPINPEDQYFQIQEVFFNEIITDQQVIANTDRTNWNNNLFSPRPYHKEFWDKFNSILETKEQKELREKLEAEIGKKNNN